jgi:poly(3-hydroxybutyrate) depolymerase
MEFNGDGGRSMWDCRRAPNWLAVFVVLAPAARADDERGFIDRVFRDFSGEHHYVVFIPHDYTPDRRWPVILFLHGAGERGTDGRAQVEVGLGRAVRARERSFPFIAVFPQCEDRDAPARRAWLPDTPDGRRALAILAEVEKVYRTDRDRVYLTGLSMGGFGVWATAAADADRWAAIVPICGGGEPAWAKKLARIPVWAFHGAEDRVVPPDESRRMIQALRDAGASPKYSELAGVGHNTWDAAYGTDELYQWLLAQKRGAAPRATPAAEPEKPRKPPTDAVAQESPFIPALEVPNAVFVRLGNDALAAIADSIPEVVPSDALAGTVADAQQTTHSEGMSFNVRLRGISYRGRLTRAIIEARSSDRVTVLLTMRNVTIVVNRTYISGEGRSATCGPLKIVLGHRRDLPISFEVEPVVADRRLRLKLHSTRFRLPRDNWSVGSPEWVSASGLGMTEDRVAQGLQSGLYADPGRFEREIIAAVPRMLEQLEARLQFEPIDRVVAGLWPFPVYRPRVRTWPTAVTTDAGGITVELGVAVAAFDERQAEAGPKTVELTAHGTPHDVAGARLQFGLAPELMEPLSHLFVATDAARADVTDMPMKQLATLADPRALAEIVPDLKRRGDVEIRSDVSLTGPITMRRIQSDSGDALELDLPKIRCSVALRTGADWAPYLEIDFSIRHAARPEVDAPTPARRELALRWQGDASIDLRARFAAGAVPADEQIDTDRLRAIMADAWREWTESGPLATAPAEDVDLGFAKLRLREVGWLDSRLAATFGPAGITIRNVSAGPVTYSLKGPYSDWGEPLTLDADGEHYFAVATPIRCRLRVRGKEQRYVLPVGTRFEFQTTTDGGLELYESREEP